MKSVVVCFAYLLYIYRQTFNAEIHNEIVAFGFLAAFGVFTIGNYSKISHSLKISRRIIILISLSFLISNIIFQEVNFILNQTAKIIIVGVLVSYVVNTDLRILRDMADSSVIFVAIIVAMSTLGYIKTGYAQNDMWVKNYAGFTNPNIGPYFIFSALSVYFITKSTVRFYFLAFVAFFIGWYALDIYSRTFYTVAILLIIYNFVTINLTLLLIYTRILSIISLVLIPVYLVLLISSMNGFINYEFWSEMDNLLSGRLTKSIAIFAENASGPIIKVMPFDSIYYEAIVVLGPLAIYLMWGFYKYSFALCVSNKIPMDNSVFLGVLMLLAGLVEGFILKFSPMLIALIIVIVSSEDNSRNEQSLSALKFKLKWRMALFGSWIAILCIYLLYVQPIYRIIIQKPNLNQEISNVDNDYFCKSKLKISQENEYYLDGRRLEPMIDCVVNILQSTYNSSRNVIPYVIYNNVVYRDPTNGDPMSNPIVEPRVLHHEKTNRWRYLVVVILIIIASRMIASTRKGVHCLWPEKSCAS